MGYWHPIAPRWGWIVKIHFDAFPFKISKDAKGAKKNEKYVMFSFIQNRVALSEL